MTLRPASGTPFFASLFFRVAAFSTLTSLVLASALIGLSIRNERHTVAVEFGHLVDTIVTMTAEGMVRAVMFGDGPRVQEQLDRLAQSLGDGLVGAVVVGADGTELGTIGQSGGLAQLASSAMARSADAPPPAFAYLRPVLNADGKTVGALALQGSPASRLAASVRGQVVVALVGVAILLAMLGVTALVMRRVLAKPMQQLSSTIRAMAEGGHPQEALLAGRRDELGEMARHLGDLADHLRTARQSETLRQRDSDAQGSVVAALREGLTAIARGSLGHDLAEPFPEAYESLRHDYNRAIANMRGAMAEVTESARRIRMGTAEMSRASDDLSKRTEHQAATLEQTAAALDQLSASVRSTADGSRAVERRVHDANGLVAQNATVMRNAMEAMSNIERTSGQISEIIVLIDDIAFQTNLLALNAGVEAARAGEAGKGFAVVASEVRALAQRSSDAARQIGELIGGSVAEVKSGARLVDRAGEALGAVVEQVTQVSELITQIAAAAEEQAIGVQEINTGVTNLDQVTQQNAAMAEEATAATQLLFEDAARLAELVEVFQTGPEAPAPVARAA